jgi:hypothetical protein
MYCLLLGMGIISCKKEAVPPGAASLIIMNAISESNTIVMNFNGTAPIWYLNAAKIDYKGTASFSSYTGTQPLGIYEYPDTTTSDLPLYNLSLSLPVGSIKTLVLTGTKAKPDSLMINDNLPFYEPADSAMGIRLIHAATGTGPVKVMLKGDPQKELVQQLAFKNHTGFFKMPVTKGIADYVLEFRDANSNTLIASYTATGVGGFDTDNNPWLRRNFSLVLIGTAGGTAPAIAEIRH